MKIFNSILSSITNFVIARKAMQNSGLINIVNKADDPFVLLPHLAPVSSEDSTLQALNRNIPISIQHFARDKGIMRFLADNSALLGAATLGASKPTILKMFLEAGKCMKGYKYGSLQSQNCQVYNFPRKSESTSPPSVLILVHGGAWGSGKPWMYRLMAAGMANALNADSAIVVQYPLYPECVIHEQAASIYEALRYIRWNEKNLGLPPEANFVLAGHSSGANICALALIDCVEKKEKLVDCFIGFCGVFNIEKHYQFEKARGAHEFSPMSVAAINPDRWWESSPTLLIPKLTRSLLCTFWPDTFLLHGLSDTTVPYSSSQEFAEQLLQQGVPVNTCYPEALAHADCIFEFTKNENSVTREVTIKYYNSFLARHLREKTNNESKVIDISNESFTRSKL